MSDKQWEKDLDAFCYRTANPVRLAVFWADYLVREFVPPEAQAIIARAMKQGKYPLDVEDEIMAYKRSTND